MYMKHGAFYLVRKRKWERLDSDYQGALLANARLVGGSGKSGMPKLEQQVVDSNPCTGIRRHTEKKCDRYITDAEFSAIYASSSDCMRCIFEMCYLTGQRISDVLAIRLADISATGITFEPQKNGAKLIVGMNPDLEDLLARVKPLPRRVRGLTLFCARSGGKPVSYETMKQAFKAACEKAKVPGAIIHDLRAKSLTDTDKQGNDAQKLGGHTDAKMTQRHLRLREIDIAQPPALPKKSL
ncbi:Tyrosine recombinase XerC [compost metagenome]|uniref:Site-specific recombinase XerD n=1 Tax=Pseudomonas wadenswilerensis TaxID=1785161 RepID=A0A380T4W9_9PSED|nr:tyrosine-type recombinase/integrase [Pseudomonas wadenswilerensis]SUQ64864.1 Site-specific recombinase XerD [Pseudomonas wadenswilerensis]